MDMTMVQFGSPSGAPSVPGSVLPGLGAIAAQPQKETKPIEAQKPVAEQVAYDASRTEKTRYENMERASQIFKDVYVVSDTKFSIYKDLSGQYVTRFTNLRDGSVTYIPEQDMLRYLDDRSKERKALITIDA